MITIYKYPIEVTDEQRIQMPFGSHVLHVGVQANRLVLWAVVDTEDEKIDHTIVIVGTGHRLPIDMKCYVGTVQMGEFVWHIFHRERMEADDAFVPGNALIVRKIENGL